MENNDYYRVQERVYDALMKKHKEDENFCFTLRKNFDRNTYKNYFTGTETSSYIAFSLWYVKNSYPGASVDPIVYRILQKDRYWGIEFQLHHTNTPTDEQNELVLEFLKSIGEALKSSRLSEEYKIVGDKPDNRMYKLIVKPIYNKFAENDLIERLIKLIDDTKDFVDKVLFPFKEKHPQFVAEKIQPESLQQMIEDRKERIRKVKNAFPNFKDVLDDVVELYNQGEEKTLRFQEPKADHIWIGDAHGKIGEEQAHYELLLEKNKKEISALVHFEKANSSEIRKRIGENLPNGFKWINWHLGEGIKIGSAQTIDNPATPQILLNSLLRTERELGQKIRSALNRISTDTTVNESAMNVILYGPPGTGKTYQTLDMVVKLCEPEIYVEGDREKNKNTYDRLIAEERVLFTTFHQSLGYEDFIEGIKPIPPIEENREMTYEVVDGIFKKLCIQAQFALIEANKSQKSEAVLDFSRAYDSLAEEMQEKLDSDKPAELESKSGNTVLVEAISPLGNIIIKHHGGDRTYTVSKQRLSKLHRGIENLDEVNNIHDHFRSIIGGSNSSAYWSVLNDVRNRIELSKKAKPISRSYSEEEKKEVVLATKLDAILSQKAKNYVIIIDEINRGNVSAIFGELITLIEEDKRFGMDNELSVKLPYSNDDFSVPPNLHIIGTMNTADRSVEALDTALRRRFTFKEMLPNPEVIALEGKADNGIINRGTQDEVDLVELLKVINRRIEVLVDRDHTIGHSYFMDVDSTEKLKQVFENKIIPLLQEYFYGDYRKMEMVIGSYFFEKKYIETQHNFFAKTANPLSVELETHHLKALDSEDVDIIDAVRVLMNEPVKSVQEAHPNEEVNS